MRYLPINLDVRGLACLVVGGGEVGRRKVEGLLECGAKVRLVSRGLTPDLQRLVESRAVEHLGPEYMTGHLEGVALVFAATNETELNARISREAEERGVWANVADVPGLCRFIVPASVKRGDLTISISTGGRSPALAGHIRTRLEQWFGPEYARFLDLMGLVRPRVLAEGRPHEENREIFRRLVESDLLDSLAQGDLDQAQRRLQEVLGPEYTLSSLEYDPEKEARA